MKSLLDRAGAAPKHYCKGTTRTLTPEQTLAWLQPMLAPMGITRVGNVTGLDRIGIPVVMVCRPNSRSLAVFQGKGLELAAAQASGLMEAVETWHAENIQRPLRWCSFEQLRRSCAVLDSAHLPQSADGWCHPQRPILWIESEDIVGNERVWVPYDAVHADFSVPGPPGTSGLRPGTNGLAGGNHLLEAISHGLCEVIERDATTLWNFLDDTRMQATEVNLDSVSDATCGHLIASCKSAGLGLRVWDATTDIGVPVYIAELRELSQRAPARWDRPAYGSGCHLSNRIAFSRAVTEAVQARTTFIAGARDDMSWQDYEGPAPAPMPPRNDADRAPVHMPTEDDSTTTISEDLEQVVACVRAAGLARILVVDLTDASFGIPVVRVIVPGLEGPDEDPDDYVPGARAHRLLASMA